MWPRLVAWIEQQRGSHDLDSDFGLVHRTFSWAEENIHRIPEAPRDDEEWLEWLQVVVLEVQRSSA